MRSTRLAAVVAAAALAVPLHGSLTGSAEPVPASASTETTDRWWGVEDRPLVIGHRGASGYRPEHTLASYELAARMGADYIEPDLVSTSDHVLVARHENEISGTTDVADRPEFADRLTTRVIDGVDQTGWFTEDFTLAELKTLRAKERLPAERQESTLYDGLYDVPTFAEVLQLRRRLSVELRRPIGVYPETKHPTYFRSIGLDLETPLVQTLRDFRLDRRRAPVFVQSFELTNLRLLEEEYEVDVPLVFLTSARGAPYDLASTGDPRTYADLTTADGLQDISDFVDGLGPDKAQVIPRLDDGTLGTPTTLVDDAHDAGLQVHPYTFRAENAFLPADYRSSADAADVADFGRAIDEQVTFLETGIDGLFTDQPDVGVVARERYLAD